MFNFCLPISVSFVHCVFIFGYVGPGAGLTMLSALLAVVLVLLLALLAPLLYLVRVVRTILNGRRVKCTLRLDARHARPGEEGQMGCS